jgi:mediator of RNA polymerase II transcription subunit 14
MSLTDSDSFCQSLQLEVLNSQTLRLIRERMGDNIRVEEYTVGRCLVVSYWRDQTKKDKQDKVGKIYSITTLYSKYLK